MQQKLEHSQLILASEVTSNWAEMERHSRSLLDLTNDPASIALKTPEYSKQSQAFVRAAEDLVDAARRKDGDAAPLAYVSMTLACVQCHRYVARARSRVTRTDMRRRLRRRVVARCSQRVDAPTSRSVPCPGRAR